MDTNAYYDRLVTEIQMNIKNLDTKIKNTENRTVPTSDQLSEMIKDFKKAKDLIPLLGPEERKQMRNNPGFMSKQPELTAKVGLLKKRIDNMFRRTTKSRDSMSSPFISSKTTNSDTDKLIKAKNLLWHSEDAAGSIMDNLKRQEETLFRSRSKARNLFEILKNSNDKIEKIITKLLENRIIRFIASLSLLLAAILVYFLSKG